jgi:hypothetical protein
MVASPTVGITTAQITGFEEKMVAQLGRKKPRWLAHIHVMT